MKESRGSPISPGSKTLRSRGWPCLRQFCVFLENRVGRLNELMRHIESRDVRVLALSIVDSVDFANVRLIFNNPDRARERLQLSGYSFCEYDVVGVVLPEASQPFAIVTTALVKAEVNIHHAFMLREPRQHRLAAAFYVDDLDLALKTLEESGHIILQEHDLLVDDELEG